MRIIFRVDSSLEIGTGHVMRCLTLADSLHEHGAECTFICRLQNGHLLDLIVQHGHRFIGLPILVNEEKITATNEPHSTSLGMDWTTDAQQTLEAIGVEMVDYLVVDHYALDQCWEEYLRPSCSQLVVIDDLANRPHDCDVLLDQNLGRSATDYLHLLDPSTLRLIGPKYALLRPEFAELRSRSLARRSIPQLKQLLITMGGMDKENVTGKVLSALKVSKLPEDLCITVVLGSNTPWFQQVMAQAQEMQRPTQVLVGLRNMAQIMVESDLAIGAAGGTAWERCCLGLPSVLLVLAENQRAGSDALQRAGAAINLEGAAEIPRLIQKLQLSGYEHPILNHMGIAAASIVDGEGVPRVVGILMDKYV
jgi:UDP-2,4-diacetamido-2,4,6-trideoxy-beta-L-altropyranose hydrolase